jgi:phage baseplate assembly protein W
MSRADRFTELTQPEELYSDLLTNFNKHPVSGMLLRFVNEKAVTRSIRNLIMTNPGERLYQPDIGSGIRNLLFEPMTEFTAIELRRTIEETLRQYEPRAQVLQVSVVSREEQNSYAVAIIYALINKQEPISVNITLQRVR